MKKFISVLFCSAIFTAACPANAVELFCEHGKRISIEGNHKEDDAIVLQWQGHLHRMLRVATSTGAHRFENNESGLIWISIPAKGMLLDRKNATQLANECKTIE
jgi:hypothetical protein